MFKYFLTICDIVNYYSARTGLEGKTARAILYYRIAVMAGIKYLNRIGGI
tara:strand:+ start:578 stop:727 length:150 start_codon:yes stop_codon:yes gene_type:complete